MNVDLFVGTLTRYYSADWQNGRTRAGEASPFGSKKSRTSVTDPVELQGVIAGWLEEATFKLKPHLKEPLSWQEGMLPGRIVRSPASLPTYSALSISAKSRALVYQ